MAKKNEIATHNQELNNLRSQIVISSWGGDRYAPFAFTEQGLAMLLSGVSQIVTPSRYNVGASSPYVFTEQGVSMLAAVLK